MPEPGIVGNLTPERLQELLGAAAPHLPQLAAEVESFGAPHAMLVPAPGTTIFTGPRDTAQSGEAWDANTVIRALRDVSDEVAKAPHSETALVTAHNLEPSLAQAALTQVALEKGWAEETDSGEIKWVVQFGQLDPGWIESVLQAIKSHFTGRAERPPLPAHPDPLPNQCRLAVVGDWGTALYGAPKFTLWVPTQPRFDAVIHLGDTYYAGTEPEVEKRLSKPWPVKPSPTESTLSRFMNGNHEMYSGGKAYFSFIKNFAQQHPQTSSCFAMQNDNWLIIGLDTSWHGFEVEPAMQSGHLDDAQVDWFKNMVANAGNRSILLLSHHEPFHFSAKTNTELTTKLQWLWNQNKVEAWYWGHEHFGVRYDRSQYGFLGRLLGHGGKPEPSDSSPSTTFKPIPDTPCRWKGLTTTVAKYEIPTWLLDGPNPLVAAGAQANDFSPQGWAVLNLDGPTLREDWFLATEAGGVPLQLP